MTSPRRCSRSGCGRSAVATLTYVYSDSTAVVGPLATAAEPHSYDLCEAHAVRLTVPRGWEVVRHEGEFPVPEPQPDDLEALADAVREAARVEFALPVAAYPASSGPDLATAEVPARPGAARSPVRSYGSPRHAAPAAGSGSGSGSGSHGGSRRAGAEPGGRRGHLRVVPTPVE